MCMAKSASPRAGNRRYILKVLATVNRVTGDLHSMWNVSGTKYGDGAPRPRRADEYPENNAADLALLCRHLDDMIRGLQVMRAEIYTQWGEVKSEENAKPQP